MGRLGTVCMLMLTLGWSVSVPGVSAEPDAPSGYIAIPDVIAGTSPDRLGAGEVRYQRLARGDENVAAAINEVIDAEARGQVATYEPSASKTVPWTFNSTGTLSFLPITVSELFVGEYNAAQPNMPFHAVATRVFDLSLDISLSTQG